MLYIIIISCVLIFSFLVFKYDTSLKTSPVYKELKNDPKFIKIVKNHTKSSKLSEPDCIKLIKDYSSFIIQEVDKYTDEEIKKWDFFFKHVDFLGKKDEFRSQIVQIYEKLKQETGNNKILVEQIELCLEVAKRFEQPIWEYW